MAVGDRREAGGVPRHGGRAAESTSHQRPHVQDAQRARLRPRLAQREGRSAE